MFSFLQVQSLMNPMEKFLSSKTEIRYMFHLFEYSIQCMQLHLLIFIKCLASMFKKLSSILSKHNILVPVSLRPLSRKGQSSSTGWLSQAWAGIDCIVLTSQPYRSPASLFKSPVSKMCFIYINCVHVLAVTMSFHCKLAGLPQKNLRNQHKAWVLIMTAAYEKGAVNKWCTNTWCSELVARMTHLWKRKILTYFGWLKIVIGRKQLFPGRSQKADLGDWSFIQWSSRYLGAAQNLCDYFCLFSDIKLPLLFQTWVEILSDPQLLSHLT